MSCVNGVLFFFFFAFHRCDFNNLPFLQAELEPVDDICFGKDPSEVQCPQYDYFHNVIPTHPKDDCNSVEYHYI